MNVGKSAPLAYVADTLGVIFAEGERPEIEALVRSNDPLFPALSGGAAQILVPGLPGADPTAAAFVNATAGTFLELDEEYRPTGHPAMHVVPAALAAAQAYVPRVLSFCPPSWAATR